LCYFDTARKQRSNKSNPRGLTSKHLVNKYGVQISDVLNIFIVEHHPDSLSRGKKYGIANGIGFKDHVKICGVNTRYNNYLVTNKKEGFTPFTRTASFMGRFLNHEIGHSLSLLHTWRANDGCDDTPNHANCWNKVEGDPNCDKWRKISNNVMDYNFMNKSFSPCQIGRVQYYFTREDKTQRDLLIPKWCNYDPKKTIVIPSKNNVVWDDSKDLEGDIVVSNGSSLTIECLVSLPKGAKIIVEENAKLIINESAHITNRCGDTWSGIEVWDNGKSKGLIDFKKGASVSKTSKAESPKTKTSNKPNKMVK